MSCAEAGEPEGCATVGQLVAESAAVMGELFNKYSVDVYNAGHSHLYAVTWPMLGGKATQKNYSNPQGTIYITEGNGAVPGTGNTTSLGKPPADWGRIHGTGAAYGIFTTDGAATLQYEHISNAANGGEGKVEETWTITNATHAQPKAPPPTPTPAPKPTPTPTPKPTPAGVAWECHQNKAYTPTTAAGLVDHDIDENAVNITACTQACNGVGPSCVAVRYHGTDRHCHGLIGLTGPSHGSFMNDSAATPVAELYWSCLLVKQRDVESTY